MAKLTPDYIEWVMSLNATQAQQEIHKLDKANKDLAKQTKEVRRAMADLEKEGKKDSAEWQNLSKSLKEYNEEIALNKLKIEELTKRLKLSDMTANQLGKRLSELRRELKNTSKAADPERYKDLQKQITATEKAMAKATSGTRSLVTEFFNLSKMKQTLQGFFIGIGSALAQSVIAGFGKAARVIVEFEQANSKLAGVLGSTKAGIADLTNEARRLGATTNYTASEVTSLQTELAKLGFDKDQIKAMEEPVLRFAVAVGTDLGSAATVAGGALRTFGKDASESEDVLATLAIATSKSALSFEHFATMLSTAAPVAHAFGFTLEDTTALMGALKNANFDASSAATATRNILLNLADSNGKLAKALGGPVKNLDDLVAGLKRLDAAGIDLATALELTDKRSVAAFETFINGADSILQLRDSITGVNGAFNDMYKEMSDNAATSMKILSSTVEGLFLKFYEGKGAFKSFIEMLTQFVQGISDTVGRANSPINLLFTGLSNLFKVIGTVVKVLSVCSRVVYAGVAAWIAYKVAVLLGNKALNIATTLQKIHTAAIIAGRSAVIALTGATKLATVATKELDAATTATAWGVIAKAVAVVAAFLLAYATSADAATDGTNKLKTAQDEITDAQNKANESIAEQVLRVNKLNGILHDNNIEMSERQKALLALKKIVPDYHAKLTKEGKLIDDNTDALQVYIKNLRAAALAQAYFDRMAEIQQEILDARLEESRKRNNIAHVQYQLDSNPDFESRTGSTTVGGSITGYTQSVSGAELNSKRTQKLQELTKQQNALAAATKKRADAEARLAAVEREMNSDKDVAAAYRAFATRGSGSGGGGVVIPKDKKDKPNRGNATAHGTYTENDKIAKVINPLKAAHEQNLADIEEQKSSLETEADYIIKKNSEIIRYQAELINALDELEKKVPEAEEKTLDAIKQKQAEARNAQAAASNAIQEQVVKKTEQIQAERLAIIDTFYQEAEQAMLKGEREQEITTEQHAITNLNYQRNHTAELLKAHEEYYEKIKGMIAISEQQRAEILKREGEKIKSLEMQQLKDMLAIQQKVAEMTADPIGLDGLERNLQREVAAVSAAYDAMISVAQQNGLETEELERQKQAKLRDLEFEHQQELWGIREQLGLSWQQEYDRELAQFQKLKDDELISEKEFQRKKLELQAQNVQRYFDYYSGAASSMFGALQQAEIDQSEAKYDELIRQAENNGEDTAALEEEKENKKLEIQKKYADVNFAIKVSQIVADTAVAIMKAFADMGPIGGAIAAAMLTATGVAQVITAKAERDKVKRLQVKSSGSKGMGSAERVLSGYSEGGYTGDGRRLEVAGVVHRGEYVVPQPIMGDPRVVDAVGVIEAIRRQRRGLPWQSHGPRDTSGAGGFAEGGYTGGGVEGLAGVAAELRAATEAVRNFRAYIVYQDIERAGEVLTQARAPFTRKK